MGTDYQVMSLNERLKAHHSPDLRSGVLARSKSCGVLVSHHRSPSGSGSLVHSSSDGSSSNNSSLSRASGSVLGSNYSPNTTRRLLQNISATWSGKPPKVPRPGRSAIIFQAVCKGLRECIKVTHRDIEKFKVSVEELSSVGSSQYQGRIYDLEKQLKAAERYLKKLEYHLSKIEELKEQYDVQQKMSDGVRTMAQAFVLSPGKERETALNSVRSGYKECVDTLCRLEAELENMIGTLLFQIKGIQGFARLCAGDVFTITIKHGEQKWKTRGKIQKHGKQSWDNHQVMFKALLGDVLYIKAVEVRTLGKSILLGNKYCETKDLFSAHPQLMTINLNPSGSLKLNLIVTWNPLHWYQDEQSSKPVPPLLAIFNSPSMRWHTNMHPPIQETSPPSPSENQFLVKSETLDNKKLLYTPDSEKKVEFSSGSSTTSASAHSSVLTSPDLEVMPTNALRCSPKIHGSVEAMENHNMLVEETSQKWPTTKSGDSSECCSIDFGNSSRTSELESATLQEVVHVLSSSLEDIQGQYPELNQLEQYMEELERILRSTSRRGSLGSSISISVQSALGCFDFLNSATDSEDAEFENESGRTEDEKILDPELTAKTSDSGIASLARQLKTDDSQCSSNPSLGPSPQPPSTGSDMLDLSLISHLVYCQRLIENLGSYGPLKCREIYSLDKLKKQSVIIGKLLELIAANEEGRSISGLSMLENEEMRQVWEQFSGGGESLCVTVEHVLLPLEHIVQSSLNNAPHSIVSEVSRLLICRLLDTSKFDSDKVITVFQVQQYFGKRKPIINHIQDIADEVNILEILQSRDPDQIKQILSALRKCIPVSEVLFSISQLLIGHNSVITRLAESYLKDASRRSLREEMLTVFLEGLEKEHDAIRQSSCAALSVLEATEYMEQLVYLTYADENFRVRQQARDALLSFGEEGRKAYEESQLFTHGFQGLNVKKGASKSSNDLTSP
ncbi:rho family-interacting cell polarization regulator 2-like isoform X1 [Centruroides vittatus]|uniref:rho family-interacting cell polarization regulator 2-like isoform X1 n=2 Tax=Centruroides vittatus TaxID=120091 RepID=UPI00350EBDD6